MLWRTDLCVWELKIRDRNQVEERKFKQTNLLDASNGFLGIFFLVTCFFLSESIWIPAIQWQNWSPAALVGTAAYLAAAKRALSGEESDFIQESFAKSGEIDCVVYYRIEHVRRSLQIINYCRFRSDAFIYSRKWSSFIASAFHRLFLNFIVEENSKTIKKSNRCRNMKMMRLNMTNRNCAGAPALCIP
jgi:hypothetical protein